MLGKNNESNHKKYDNTSKEIKLNHYEDSLKKKVTKGVRRMPWLSEAKKDVTSCDKLRGGANIRYIRRFPNGVTRHAEGVISRAIGRLTRRTETSKYPEEKKTNSDSLSSGDRTGNSPNRCRFGGIGVEGPLTLV